MFLYILLLALPIVYSKTLHFVVEFASSGPTYELFDWFRSREEFLNESGLTVQLQQGKLLRSTYIKDLEFLPRSYSKKALLVEHMNSTQASAAIESYLKGLYPKASRKAKLDELKDMFTRDPTDLGNHTVRHFYRAKGNDSIVVAANRICPGVSAMISKYRRQHKEEIDAISRNYEETYKNLTTKANLTNDNIQQLLMNERNYDGFNLSLEEKESLLKIVKEVSEYEMLTSYLNVNYGNRSVSKILASGFLMRIKKLLKDKVDSIKRNDTSPLKAVVYMSNDIMLNAILINLQINLKSIATSNLIIELFENNGNYSINLKVQNTAREYSLDTFYMLISNNIYKLPDTKQFCKDFIEKEPIETEENAPIAAIEYLIITLISTASIAVVLTLLSCCLEGTSRLKRYS